MKTLKTFLCTLIFTTLLCACESTDKLKSDIDEIKVNTEKTIETAKEKTNALKADLNEAKENINQKIEDVKTATKEVNEAIDQISEATDALGNVVGGKEESANSGSVAE